MPPQHRNGREPDPEFTAEESLYQRFNAGDLIGGHTVNPLRLRFPGQSVARSKYSVPRDVLHPDCCGAKVLANHGVLTIAVGEIEGETFILEEKNSQRAFRLFMLHKPEETCFAHSEIWCNVLTERPNVPERSAVPSDLPKGAKQAFRAEIARKLTILITTEETLTDS